MTGRSSTGELPERGSRLEERRIRLDSEGFPESLHSSHLKRTAGQSVRWTVAFVRLAALLLTVGIQQAGSGVAVVGDTGGVLISYGREER